MRRFLYFLPLLLALGCTLAPDNSSRHAPPPEDSKPAPAVDNTKPTRRLDKADMEKLARTDPIAFVKECIQRYDREVHGYRCILDKVERVQGELHDREVVRCSFREKPFSVLMEWQKGNSKALKTLFVKGENNNELLARPRGAILSFLIVSRDPESPDARASSRFPVTQFGIRLGMQSTLDAWERAKKRGDLKIVCNGVKRREELSDRPCWELQRVGYTRPEDDGILGATFYFDCETWLQVGSVLVGADDQLIARYFFRDIERNPDFPPDTFTRAALKRK